MLIGKVLVLSLYDDTQQWPWETAIGFEMVTDPDLTYPLVWYTTCSWHYQQLLTHEMFHAWNGDAGIIQPVGAPFTHIKPEMWFEEGATQYYGFRGTPNDLELYQRRITHAWQYYSERIGTQYDIPLIEMNEMWITTGDGQYGQMCYDKGACLFYLLDHELITLDMSLDDLMQYMYVEFGLQGQQYTTIDVLNALNAVTNLDWSGFFDRYIYGNEPLPLDGSFEYLWH